MGAHTHIHTVCVDIVVCVFGQAPPPKELVSAGMSLNSTLAPEEPSAKEQDKETNGTFTQDLFWLALLDTDTHALRTQTFANGPHIRTLAPRAAIRV